MILYGKVRLLGVDGLHCPPVHSDTRRIQLSESNSEHLFDKAMRLAVHAHAGHVDRAGKPYLLHVLQVVGGCGDDLMASTVAALHDVVEDSALTLRDLKEQGFPQAVVDAVDALTRREGEAYEDCIERVSKNVLATKVKRSDLLSNLDVRRLTQVTTADTSRLERYRKAWERLGG
jgi:(p)ppGpp synthase/HD superfamily hydrolase